MAQNTITNKSIKNGYVTINVGSGGAFYLNNSGAGLGANGPGEVVQTMNIVDIKYSIANNAFYTIRRGANTVAVLAGTDNWALNDGMLIDTQGGEPSANVVVTKTGAGPSTMIIKLHKRSAVAGGSIY
jgi:hypothetical protein